MKKKQTIISIIILLLMMSPCSAQVPTEESLLSTWEQFQTNDPQNLLFEKIEDGRYKFQTKRFPYNGEIHVLNLSIDETPGAYDTNTIMGVIEVELTDLPEDFYSIHSHSFATWQQTNYFYYDHDLKRWISSKEWQTKMYDKPEISSPWWSCLNSFWIFLIIFLVIFIILLSRKASSQMKYAMAAQDTALDQQRKALDDQQKALQLGERSVELAEKMTSLLSQILEELRNKKDN